MRRMQLAEMQDQPWCPAMIRDGLTAILQLAVSLGDHYEPALRRLPDMLEHCNTVSVVDLCSGGGGPWPRLRDRLGQAVGVPVHVCLTDKYPNRPSFAWLKAIAPQGVTFHPEPVDAVNPPPNLAGVRTLFGSFHHFPPDRARTLLTHAAAGRQGIAVFEVTQRSVRAILLMLLAPLLVLAFAPFARPFRWSRIMLTYVLPLLPLVALIDGVVSCLRTYTPGELRHLTEGLDGDYVWETGEDASGPSPVPITFLVGYPRAD